MTVSTADTVDMVGRAPHLKFYLGFCNVLIAPAPTGYLLSLSDLRSNGL